MMESAIVILHGWRGKIEKWFPFKKELERADFEVFLPELPGFGKAEPPNQPWGVSDYAGWVQGYIKGQSLQDYFLICHSFGGRIGIKLASQNPAGLKGLILINSAGMRPKKTFKRFIFLVLAKIGKPFFVIPPLSIFKNFARKILYTLAREKDYYQARGVMKEILKKVVSEDLREDLKRIKVSTLILWGEKDSLTSLSDGKLMNRLISGSSLRVFPNAGHSLPLKSPGEVALEIIKFAKMVK